MGRPIDYRAPHRKRNSSPLGMGQCSVYDTPLPWVPERIAGVNVLFPHIRERKPHLYEQALADHQAYEKVKMFRRTYQGIVIARASVSLKLDERDKLVMEFTDPASLSAMIKDAVVDKVSSEVLDRAVDKLKTKIMTKRAISRLAKFNAVLEYAIMLFEIKKDIDNKNLVIQQKGSRKREAEERKLRFCTLAIAVARLGSPNHPRVWEVSQYFLHQFKKFEAKQTALFKWRALEERLAGTYQSGPEWHARRK